MEQDKDWEQFAEWLEGLPEGFVDLSKYPPPKPTDLTS